MIKSRKIKMRCHQTSVTQILFVSFLCILPCRSLRLPFIGKARAEPTPASSPVVAEPQIDWEVYVDQSKAGLEKGSAATFDAFLGLAPPNVIVIPAIFPKGTKNKMPMIRCVSLRQPKDSQLFRSSGGLDVNNVDSVDKVFRVLTRHMKVFAKWEACECLKWKYKGNGHLEANEIDQAIAAYDKALACDWTDQKGIILLMRANALLRRALSHKEELRILVQKLSDKVPEFESLVELYQVATANLPLAGKALQKIANDARRNNSISAATRYRHGLYQFALLHAAQDAFQATQLLPNNSKSWLQAGEILRELWKLDEALVYYELALQLDPDLKVTALPIIDGLQKRKELYDAARAYGYEQDMLRFALDVAA